LKKQISDLVVKTNLAMSNWSPKIYRSTFFGGLAGSTLILKKITITKIKA
jgi:hypothetical protein